MGLLDRFRDVPARASLSLHAGSEVVTRLVVVLAFLGCARSAGAVVNGFRMRYEDRGRGEAVVFLHGYTLDSRMWDGQLRFFKKYRVVAPDMRFHGRSAAPEDSAFDAAEAAEDVRALLDRLKIARAHLVGLSMGGAHALETTLRHPDRVLSLTLVSAPSSTIWPR
jgi:pimeloyl-ACP methyl ester carboxylesterase